MKKLISVISMSMMAMSAFAADYAIVGGTVHTMSEQGTIKNGTVLIKDGKVQRVSQGETELEGYEVIDATGKVVTPGLFGAFTSLGLVEVGLSAGTVDSTSKATMLSTAGAAYDVSFAVNPDSSLINISRVEGITTAASSMSRTDQLFQGMGAVISLGDNTDPVLKRSAFTTTVVSNGGADDVGGSRANLWVALETALSEAQYADGKSLNPSVEWHGMLSKADAKALGPIVKGEAPLVVDARRAADIRQVIALKSRYPNLNVVLLEATEAWRVADELANANIPVILDPESNLPYQFDQLAATLTNAGRLHAAGVTVAIGINTHNIRLAKQNAGNAVANGLPWEAGLASLTINPAKIYGMDDRLGSLDSGKQADVVIWSGDPLEVAQGAELVIINGEKIDMESRQSKLRDRYLSRDIKKTVSYSRP